VVAVEDHEGNKFRSVTEMCTYWGIQVSTYRYRKRAGFPLKACLTTEDKRAKKCKDHNGKEFNCVSDMCYHWDISKHVFMRRSERGYCLEDCLTDKWLNPDGSCVDCDGKHFTSIEAMCKHWGITVRLFNDRYKCGYLLKSCLTGEDVDFNRGRHACEDHEGKKFESYSAMCEYWGISYSLFSNRRALGYDLRQCLTGDGVGKRRQTQDDDVDGYI